MNEGQILTPAQLFIAFFAPTFFTLSGLAIIVILTREGQRFWPLSAYCGALAYVGNVGAVLMGVGVVTIPLTLLGVLIWGVWNFPKVGAALEDGRVAGAGRALRWVMEVKKRLQSYRAKKKP